MMAAEWLRTTPAPFSGNGRGSRDLTGNCERADTVAWLVTA